MLRWASRCGSWIGSGSGCSGLADPQFTIGAYRGRDGFVDGFAGGLAELRLWRTARTADQLLEARFRRLLGSELELNAYWTFDGTASDITGNGADGQPAGNPPSRYLPSQAPVANEGPQVRNVYGGQVTDFQEPLTGRPATVEYSEVETRFDGTPYAVMRRRHQPPPKVGERRHPGPPRFIPPHGRPQRARTPTVVVNGRYRESSPSAEDGDVAQVAYRYGGQRRLHGTRG